MKRCPFCGSLAYVVVTEDDSMHTHYVAKCQSCPAMVSWFSTEKEAEKAWNRRAEKEAKR